jgi:hypothetical protein
MRFLVEKNLEEMRFLDGKNLEEMHFFAKINLEEMHFFAKIRNSQRSGLERYNIFSTRMLVRCDEDGKLYLYDLVRTKKETSKPLEH